MPQNDAAGLAEGLQKLKVMGSVTEVPFGKPMKEHFLLDPEWRNLNNGM